LNSTLNEFAYNNTIHVSTQKTSFYANYGSHPKFNLLSLSKSDNLTTNDFEIQLLQLQITIIFYTKKLRSLKSICGQI